MATTIEEINALVAQLEPSNQESILKLAQTLVRWQQTLASMPISKLPPGKPGHVFLDFLQHSSLSLEDVEAMERALEDCERIEPDEY